MLNEIKLLLGIDPADTDLDEKITLIIGMVTARLRLLLGDIDPPQELYYIIREVTVMRFNRIGSEGMASHSVEGESLQFTDDDFAAYRDDISDWLARNGTGTKGKLRFL